MLEQILVDKNLPEIKDLLENKPNLATAILFHACRLGRLDVVKFLIEDVKLDVNTRFTAWLVDVETNVKSGRYYDLRVDCPLSIAALNAQQDIVVYLIEKGAKVNLVLADSTILEKAILSRNMDVVKTLITAKVYVDAYDLNAAIKNSSIEMVETLMAGGGKLQSCLENYPIIETAVKRQNKLLLEFLIQQLGIAVEGVYSPYKSLLKDLVDAFSSQPPETKIYGEGINYVTELIRGGVSYDRALLLICELSSATAVKFLLQCTAGLIGEIPVNKLLFHVITNVGFRSDCSPPYVGIERFEALLEGINLKIFTEVSDKLIFWLQKFVAHRKLADQFSELADKKAQIEFLLANVKQILGNFKIKKPTAIATRIPPDLALEVYHLPETTLQNLCINFINNKQGYLVRQAALHDQCDLPDHLKRMLISDDLVTEGFTHKSKNRAYLFDTYRTYDPNHAFRRAAAGRTLDQLKKIFSDYEIDINQQDNNVDKKYTALHWAVKKNKFDNVKFLLDKGASYSTKDASGKTVVDYLLAKDLKEQLAIILNKVLVYYGTSDQDAALRRAANHGDLDNLKVLLYAGANVNAKANFSLQTALHRAVIRGQYQCAELLLRRGADYHLIDRFKKSPIDYSEDFSLTRLLEMFTAMRLQTSKLRIKDCIKNVFVRFQASQSIFESTTGCAAGTALQERLIAHMEMDTINIFYNLMQPPPTGNKVDYQVYFPVSADKVRNQSLEKFAHEIFAVFSSGAKHWGLEKTYIGESSLQIKISFPISKATKVIEKLKNSELAPLRSTKKIIEEIEQGLLQIAEFKTPAPRL